MRDNVKNIKAAKKVFKSSPTAIDVSYLIMLHNDGSIDKKYQPTILTRSRKNHDAPKMCFTKDILNFRVASPLITNKYNFQI